MMCTTAQCKARNTLLRRRGSGTTKNATISAIILTSTHILTFTEIKVVLALVLTTWSECDGLNLLIRCIMA